MRSWVGWIIVAFWRKKKKKCRSFSVSLGSQLSPRHSSGGFFFPSLSLLPLALLFGLEVQPFPLLKPRLTHLLTVLVSKRKEEKTRRGENRPGCRGPSLFLDTLSRLSVFLCCEVCVVLKGAPKTLFPLKNSNIGFSLSI